MSRGQSWPSNGNEVIRLGTGNVTEIQSFASNGNKLEAQGLDLQLQSFFDTGIGMFNLGFFASYQLEYNLTAYYQGPVQDTAGFYLQPRTRAQFTGSWNLGDWGVDLVVDYIGIAPQLKEALATYSAAKGKGRPTIDSEEALRILLEKLQVARDMLHPVDWSSYQTNALQLIPECMDHLLEQEDGKRRYCDTVLQITKAFALCGTLDGAMEVAQEVAFHQAIRAPLIKGSDAEGHSDEAQPQTRPNAP